MLISRVYSRKFVCFLHCVGLDNISLGIHVNWLCPNLELHLPFCFIRIGWSVIYKSGPQPFRSFGYRRDKWL